MESLVEFLVLGLPEDGARLDLRPIHVFAAKADERQTTAGRLKAVDEATLLAFGGFTLVEDHAVTGLEWAFEAHRHTVGANIDDRAEVGTALLAETGVDKLLVIDAAEPAWIKAARERHLHRVILFLPHLQGGAIGVSSLREGIPGGIDRAAVGLRNRRDIFRGLQATFNLQRTDTRADEVRDDLNAREVLRGKQVGLVAEVAHDAIDHEFIGQTAGLSAFAAISRTAAEGFTRQTLTRIGNAEGAVDEDLEIERHTLGGLLGLQLLHLRDRDLASEDGERSAQITGVVDAGGTRHRHLRRSVNREVGRDAADEAADTWILNDGGVDAGSDDRAERAGGFREFVRED